MSRNRRKNSPPKPAPAAEESVSARVVAIPKTQEFPPISAVAPQEITPVPEPVPVVLAPEPEPQPIRETRVVLAEPKQEPRPEPKAAKPKIKSDRIGDVLRAARLERNDDLYLIAEYLCIKPAFLIALENSRYDEFPADAYVIGFLRTYANFLGVDGKDAVDRYRYEMAGRRKKPILSMPTPVSEGRAPSGIIMAGAAIAVLLIYALWYGISSANRTETRIPPPLPTATQVVPMIDATATAGLTEPVAPAPEVPAKPAAEASVSPVTPAPEAATTPVIPPASPGIMVTADKPPSASAAKTDMFEKTTQAAPPEAPIVKAEKDVKPKAEDKKPQVPANPALVSRVVIRATQSSWVMIVDDSGKTIFDHVMKAGDVYQVPNKQGLSLTTGNGSGIELSLDGKDLPKVATGAPHVVRNIALDPDRLSSTPTASDH